MSTSALFNTWHVSLWHYTGRHPPALGNSSNLVAEPFSHTPWNRRKDAGADMNSKNSPNAAFSAGKKVLSIFNREDFFVFLCTFLRIRQLFIWVNGAFEARVPWKQNANTGNYTGACGQCAEIKACPQDKTMHSIGLKIRGWNGRRKWAGKRWHNTVYFWDKQVISTFGISFTIP